MKRAMALLLILGVLLCCGCAAKTAGQDENRFFHIYYARDLAGAAGGDAIGTVDRRWEDLPQDDKQLLAQAALELLLAPCEEKGFRSPVPGNTKLLSCELRGGVAWVDFSAPYGQLTGIALTIADYCVALTLTQISGIHSVHITVNGTELTYRDNHQFFAGDVLLTSTDDVLRTLRTPLYFPDEAGILTAEERLLTVYEGENRLSVVLDALAAGPEDTDRLRPLLPEGFSVLSVWVDGGLCWLNLPAEDLALLPETYPAQRLLVQGLVNSLCGAADIDAVQILVDGESTPQLGEVDISQPLAAK
mgnify:CR=1 FL=1